MSGNVEAKTTHEFTAPAEDVFDAWLDPVKVRSWFAEDARTIETDPQVGGKFTFSDMREDGEAVHWGYYKEITRPQKLVFTWFTDDEEKQEDNSVVTLNIEQLADGCRATIIHSMDARWAEWVEQTVKGWASILTAIDSYLSSN